MHRVPEVIDVFGLIQAQCLCSMAIIHLKIKKYLKSIFLVDFISEAVDQTRGWFYSLLAISTLIFDEESYKNVGRFRSRP